MEIGTDVSLLGGSGNGKFRGLPRMRIFYCNWFKDSDFWSARCWVVRPVLLLLEFPIVTVGLGAWRLCCGTLGQAYSWREKMIWRERGF